MGERTISESDLRLVIEEPEDVRPGRTGTLAYQRVVDGRKLIAILTTNTTVPIVVTDAGRVLKRRSVVYVTYDDEADVLYVRYREQGEYAFSRDHGDGRYVEYDADGSPIGVELIGASRGVDIRGLPDADEIARGIRELTSLLGTKVAGLPLAS